MAAPVMAGYVTSESGPARRIELRLRDLTDDERRIILDGCLINFYNSKR